MVHHSERTAVHTASSTNRDRIGNSREKEHRAEEYDTPRTSASVAAVTMDRAESDSNEPRHHSGINSPAAAAADVRSETAPDERSLSCENRPHFYYPEWTGEECDHESFMCFSEGVNHNCCKCRPECCGQCTTLTSFSDPYQACPTLSAKAYERSLEDHGITPVTMVAVAIGISAVFGIILALWQHSLERRRRMMEQDDKTKNLRAYRDQDDVDDGVFRDKPYR
ncbi:unnamed protein product [Cylindrotheca closterium]|uniref:Uncharacterized protein n=1 Tax=Cylindrotheca closterium TaxID=2856 RepID=A0AAD2FYG3_9STRA|nr:unnamed protein product [Cylindrotheca closterium]